MKTTYNTLESESLISPQKQSSKCGVKCSKKRVILITFFILILLALTFAVQFMVSKFDKHNNKSTVLPNTHVKVYKNTHETFNGLFTVNSTEYEFKSTVNETLDYVSFKIISYSDDFNVFTYSGFSVSRVNNSIIFVLFDFNYGMSQIIIRKEITLTNEEQLMVQSFLNDRISLHFVELSIKLGSEYYIGNYSSPILDIHQLAKWIYTFNEADTQWDSLEDEINTVNSMVLDEKSESTNSRNLLQGNCVLEDKCGNSCFGRCGNDCNCWSFVCGDCECWLGCQKHDEYCSCGGMLEYCCINIFWVKCDGSGNC